MVLENPFGFGCAVFGPGGDWRRCQGFFFHSLIIRKLLAYGQALAIENLTIFLLRYASRLRV
jgi:hypothetical protein